MLLVKLFVSIFASVLLDLHFGLFWSYKGYLWKPVFMVAVHLAHSKKSSPFKIVASCIISSTTQSFLDGLLLFLSLSDEMNDAAE